jgi:LPS O-antigen subunit length determinant protein (WzzB/FepE family)
MTNFFILALAAIAGGIISFFVIAFYRVLRDRWEGLR